MDSACSRRAGIRYLGGSSVGIGEDTAFLRERFEPAGNAYAEQSRLVIIEDNMVEAFSVVILSITRASP
jgi:uncharacterized protein YigE (DUF2233 family)